MDEFEKIFQIITGVVLGKKLTGYMDYEQWLSKDVTNNDFAKSVLSGNKIYLPPFQFYQDVKHNLVTIEEAYDSVGKRQLSQTELSKLSFSDARELLKNISITTPNTIYGENSNMVDCALYYNSHSCFRGCSFVSSKYSLYSFWPRQSDYTLGCFYTFSSQFCIKCFNSENLNRCFEMSDCSNCTDSLFCHNCENLNSCMFCFNVKAKRYAIANVEVGRDAYIAIRNMVLAHIYKELEQTKALKINIFNLGQKNGS